MRRVFGGKQNRDSGALRRLTARLKAGGHVLLLAVLVLGVLVAAGRLNFAVAVHMDGDLLGYVSNREELSGIVDRVETSVSDALGRPWAPEQLTTYVALRPSADSGEELAEKMIASVPELRQLQVVYVDGEAVCAYETREEAAKALETLAGSYAQQATEKVRFLEEVVVAAAVVDDRLLLSADEALADAVTVETRDSVTVTKTIPCDVHEIEDTRLFQDEGYVECAGQDGFESVKYDTVCLDGQMTQCREIGRIRQEPVTEIVVVGTRVHRSTGDYIWPVESGWLSSPFGLRSGFGSSDHHGVDIANDAGTEIMAADGGVVLFADDYYGFGLIVKIQHENGDITYYAHCSQLLVSEGERVAQGQVIALMGCTGVASGNHCHFEVHPGGGEAEDPMDYLPPCPYPVLEG